MINVIFYNAAGKRMNQAEYATADGAFMAIASSGLDALASPKDTTSGCYWWDKRKEGHSLQAFRAKMAMCCNNPAEYSRRLIAAGICRMTAL